MGCDKAVAHIEGSSLTLPKSSKYDGGLVNDF